MYCSSLPLGCWQLLQWGSCRGRVIPWACGSEDGAEETQWQVGPAATSPFCFSGESHSCYLSHYTPPRAAMFYHRASLGESFGGDRQFPSSLLNGKMLLLFSDTRVTETLSDFC